MKTEPSALCLLIPGCGSGYEVQAFHAAGHEVTAIDFSPAAVARAKRILGRLGERVIFGDFFTHDFAQRRFDLIYERTFLCSMTPSWWPKYVNRVADLLSAEGKLIGIFLYGQPSMSGPPFPLTDSEGPATFQKTLSTSDERTGHRFLALVSRYGTMAGTAED